MRLEPRTGGDPEQDRYGLSGFDEQLFMPTVLEDVAFGPLNQGAGRERAFEIARTALEHVGMLDAGARRRIISAPARSAVWHWPACWQ